ncbi:elongator complex protein [Verticillium alfalfae VaMs.102]|uniref:Elongator complex protein n=1 Tax=Verticillium alfalfae (strain VaMs.102 / ATCC MYA-4576 / FGSC 10136) TaxID=526221 RepID=C9SKE0_VERA1|nr:elongator complex protein [Verticillium alfalfae VaMs.102]EEY19158.1 elongator complex protein [Verticillium alfalfae VaMs.102]
MRNLRNIRFGQWSHADITSTCWDPANDDLLCTVGPTEARATIDLVRISDQNKLSSKTVATWDAPSPNPDVTADSIISVHHFSDTATTCIILAGGDIITVQESETFSSGQDAAHIEMVGSIDAGITAARWSPDDELLTITTGDGNAVFMGRTFDPIAEVAMTARDFAASKHVSVGWGKKETQFEGRGAKALRDPTIPEKVDEGVLSTQDDRQVTITWRGDGTYVAVNAIEGSRRVVRVYTREGVLDSASEPVDGLEGSLSWRPAGNLLAAVQRFKEKIDVVFFERNGLRHGQFTLRSPDGPVTEHGRIRLEWNADSTVLAVILGDKVQLWTMGNYHWYLKQEIPHASSAPPWLAWHPEKALRLALATTDALTASEYTFTVARGALMPPYDFGAVAVADGQTVKVTPIRTANVPPPMSLFDLEVPSNIVEVVFNVDNSRMAVLHRQGLELFQWETKGERALRPKLLGSATFESLLGDPRARVPLQTCFSASDELCVLVFDQELKIEVFNFTPSTSTFSLANIHELSDLDPVSSISSHCGLSDAEAYAQDRSGKLFSLSGGAGLTSLGRQLPAPLAWQQLVNIEDQSVSIGMTRNGHLFADTHLLAKNCTSFVVTDAHIIFTTNNHFVKFVHLVSPDEMEVPGDNPQDDERCRSIERGARLITAMPTNMSIVLQMPRGNLETIYPRAMVVAGIRKLVDEKNYARAFSYCRTQRVDMNILYDHQPEQFLAHVGLFLDQLKDVTYIDLFLSSLREEDVTQSMYKDTKRTADRPSEISPDVLAGENDSKSKVNKICNSILKSLQSKKDTNLQNIITAHVCKVPPALDDGLTLTTLWVFTTRELALLVLSKSQRDPREYLPFIQDLHQLPTLRRHFQIDDHLERRGKALVHLKSLDVFDELQQYVVKYALYQEALDLYRYDKPKHRTLTNLFAEHSESGSKYRDAGLAYEFLENYSKATACYRASGASSWRECLYAAQQQTPALSPDALSDLASSLADALTEAKDHTSAATIYIEYLSSIETAIRSLCKGSQFAEALRLISQKARLDLLSTVFDPALVDALSSTTDLLADCKAQLRAQVPRIMELRRRAEEDPLAFYEGERGPAGADIP